MSKKAIIDKISACLRLSQSSNEHEAAMALKQAQALMQKHGITDTDIVISNVSETSSKIKSKNKPAGWVIGLASLISKAFGVRTHLQDGAGHRTSEMHFIGLGVAPEIARYAFNVLYRQCTKSRKEHYDSFKRVKRSNRIKRADLFAQAWVWSVTKTVQHFADECPKQEGIINTYLAEHHPDLVTFKARKAKADKRSMGSAVLGFLAADGVTLNHGINGTDTPIALDHQS